MKTIYKLSLSIFFLIVIIGAVSPVPVKAANSSPCNGQDYCLLESLPGITTSQVTDPATGKYLYLSNIKTFIPAAIKLVIGVAGGLAIIRIIIGGMQYMTTDSFGGKGDAKKTIAGAVYGLLLAIGAFSILFTINPALTKLNIVLKQADQSKSKLDLGVGDTLGAKTAVETGCTDQCVAIPPDKIKIKAQGACSNSLCYINTALESKLEALTKYFENKGLDWQVTKAFPSVFDDELTCDKEENAGKCVDMALTLPTTDNIAKFLIGIEATFGSKYTYERCDENQQNPLAKDPKLAAFKSHMVCTSNTSQHVRVILDTSNTGVIDKTSEAKAAAQLGCTNNCVAIDPTKIPLKSINACSNPICYVNAKLETKLEALNGFMKGRNIDWNVTEAFPQTVAHADDCHKPNTSQSGECVDAAIIGQVTIERVAGFLLSIDDTFGTSASYAYEKCNADKTANPYSNEPKLALFKDHFKCYPTTTAEHAHINLN